MTWFSTIPTVIVLASIIYLPGLLITLGYTRRPWLLAGLSPLLSASVLAIAALLSGAIPGTWGIPLIIAVTAVLAVLSWTSAYLLRPRHRSARRYNQTVEKTSLRIKLLTGCALVINAFMVLVMFVIPTHGANAINQIYDTPFHFSVIRWIIDNADASSLHTVKLDGTANSIFYPSLWHGWVSLGSLVTGASIPLAVNASTLVILLFIWPLCMGTLTKTIVGDQKPYAYPIVIALASIFGAFPWNFLSFGPLYSNQFSYAIAPAYMAVLLLLIRYLLAGRFKAWQPLCGMVCTILLGFIAFTFAQPNSLFTLAVLIFPALCMGILELGMQGGKKPLLISVVAVIALVILAVFLWIKVHDASFMQRTVTWVWPPYHTPLKGLLATLSLATTGGGAQIGLAMLVLAALIYSLFKPYRWLAISYVLISFLYWLASSVNGTFRDYATGFWYHDSTRLSAAMVLIALPLLAILFSTGIEYIFSTLSSSSQKNWLIVACALALVGMNAQAYTGSNLDSKRFSISSATDKADYHFLNEGENKFMSTVQEKITGDKKIANNPFDGSALGYPLFKTNVLFPAFEGNWMGKPTKDQTIIRTGLAEVVNKPDVVCPAVKDLNIGYVIRLGRDTEELNYDPERWKGIDKINSDTKGFKLIAQEGKLSLYKITACNN
ncbi:hypothetical protein KRX54_05490 [Actinomycetaceae bacterium TAE3-ERU4]|nr:hypothetical protein [Actinomycetaceae bacterium TAE3-ERU4]